MRPALTVAVALSLFAIARPAPAADTAPAPARTVDAVDEAFGLRLPDPYRWMEGEDNAEFASWLGAQGAYGRARLDALPRLGFWRERLAAVAQAGVINRLQQPMAGRIFFLRLSEGREGVLMVRERNGKERVLLDPATRSAGSQTAAISAYSPSPDGKRVAVNVQVGGSEISRVELLSVADGLPSREVVEDVWGEFAVSWLPDGSAFTYTQLAPREQRDASDPLLDERLRLHRLGTPVESDPVLLARGTHPQVPLERSEFPFLDLSSDSRFALLVVGTARPQVRVFAAPKSEALQPGAPWRSVVEYDDNVQQVALHGDRLYVASMRDHPNGRVLALDLGGPATVPSGKVVMPEDRVAVVTGLAAAADALYVRRMEGGPDRLLRLPYAGGSTAPIPLPFTGAVYLLNTDPRAPGAVFTLQGWTRPRTAFRVSPGGGLQDLHLGAASPADYSMIVAEEVTVRSADGTEVPLSIVRRRDADRARPGVALLDGYGGYGTSEQPFFDPLTLEWVKAGNLFAVAHVRGGGEKGDAWRVAGSRGSKERGVEDFVACAQALIARGWAAQGTVVATGGSAGGVLVGGAITRSPEVFGAAVIQAGVLNPSRLQVAKNGANQFAEFGDPRTAEGLRWLAAMDPYQRIRDGTRYPAVLLVVGLNDNRVSPWQSGKFGARLLAAGTGGKPVWYRTDQDEGHFHTAQGAQARQSADVYAFAEAFAGE